ncbi:MAG TPA: hypothetical protein VF269_02460 [Rhodanobacteraceae bacterium]
MNSNIASSKSLGFGVLAIASWMFFVTHSGLVAPAGVDHGVMHAVMCIAAIGLLIAGIMAFVRHEGWLAFFFLLWAGMAWASSQPMGWHGGGGDMGHGSALFDAWFFITITLVNLYLWLGSMKNRKLGGAVSITVLLIWVAWLLMALACFLNIWILGRIGGVVGLASAVVAFYVSAGSVLAENGGRKLPCIGGEDHGGQA